MEEAEHFYQNNITKSSDRQKSLLCDSGKSFRTYVEYVSGLIQEKDKIDKTALKNALTHRKGSVNSMLLNGRIGQEMTSIIQSLLLISEENIDTQLKGFGRKQKNDGKKSRPEDERLVLLLKWKTIGGTEDRYANCPMSGESLVGYDAIKVLVSEEKVAELYTFHKKYEPSKMMAENPLRIMYESCLHIPATEADCERFFRILSLVVNKPYQVNINPERVCQIAFVKSFTDEIYYSIGVERSKRRSVYDIFLKS